MFKRLNRLVSIGLSLNRFCITLGLLLIGTCSSVFAVDFSQMIDQAKQDVFGIGDIIEGEPTVANLYSKALKLTKHREISSSTDAFDQLVALYATCPGIETQDIINILYNSNVSFNTTFVQLFPSAKAPSKNKISKSYSKFLSCKGRQSNSTTISTLNNEINSQYFDIYSNSYMVNSLNSHNFGSDLFWNGTLDDSAFDLLFDIEQIGKILFDNFTESPQILFYTMPSLDSATTDTSTSSYQVGAGGGSFPGTVSYGNETTDGEQSSSSSSQLSEGLFGLDVGSLPDVYDDTVRDDSVDLEQDEEITQFIESNKSDGLFSDTQQEDVALFVGNQCLVSSGIDDALYQEEEEPLMDPAEYISGIANFINTANGPAAVDLFSLQNFHDALEAGASPEQVANAYTEQVFGEPLPGTCEYSCQSLPLLQQAKCEFDCAVSCIQSCTANADAGDIACTNIKNDSIVSCNLAYTTEKNRCETLPFLKKSACLTAAATQKASCLVSAATQKTSCSQNVTMSKALCISDCTCFMIAGPNGQGREKMEDMYRIKFCKVPVQTKTVPSGQKVTSIQAIFQVFSDAFEGLRDSGQMTKFTKTHEFLDGNIKINFADNFAFKIKVSFKPLFEKTSASIVRQQQIQENRDLNISILDMNISAPEADDYNKYIVVSDPIKNKVSLESFTSLDNFQEKIDSFTVDYMSSKNNLLNTEYLSPLVTSYGASSRMVAIQSMIEFLTDNQTLWNNMTQVLLDMNAMSFELKNKINAVE